MNEPIAIVGSSCRFPGGASSPSKLWELLRNPKDVLAEFPPERLNLSSFYNKSGDHHGSTDVPNKSYLLTEDHRLFDASFFNINPMEADSMDPQQRFLLETVYEAFECAGYTIAQMQETLTSVFVGAMTGDYYDIQLRDTEVLPRYHATGTARSMLSNRISYFFNLTGPSMTIDTACSSSLVALHQAVLSLRNGDSKYAVVAGANILLDPTMYIAESKLHMLSPTARSSMWDASANGYAVFLPLCFPVGKDLC
jgi:aspyridone synthetase (hybrid polyketide synthase/nonribosomal peptide synthetase)